MICKGFQRDADSESPLFPRARLASISEMGTGRPMKAKVPGRAMKRIRGKKSQQAAKATKRDEGGPTKGSYINITRAAHAKP